MPGRSGARILIIRLSALGDVVHALPSLARLREALPEATIGWAVEDRAASLLQGHPQLDRLHVVPRGAWANLVKKDPLAVLRGLRRQARELRAGRYDVTLDFQSNTRSAALAWLSGAPRRIGQPKPFAKEAARLFATESPPPVGKTVHKIERNLQLLLPLGITGPAPRPLIPEPEALGAAADAIAAGARPLVVIHPGVSVFGALKAWPEERFAALGARLAADGARVLFAWGGAAEERLARSLAAAAPGTEAAPRTAGILGFAALLRRADLVVGVDSGPLHLAAAVGAPVLGLYGPKHPQTYGPFWGPHEVVRSGIECSPCRYRRCPREDARPVSSVMGDLRISPCMDRLEVEVALDAARRLLATRASHA